MLPVQRTDFQPLVVCYTEHFHPYLEVYMHSKTNFDKKLKTLGTTVTKVIIT